MNKLWHGIGFRAPNRRSPSRHFDEVRTIDDLWHGEVVRPVDGGLPVVEVDADAGIDVAVVLDDISNSIG